VALILNRSSERNWRAGRFTEVPAGALIVLACAEDDDHTPIAGCLGGSPADGRPLAFAVTRRGVDDLLHEPPPGAPRKVRDSAVEKTITLMLESKPRDDTHWRTRLERGVRRCTNDTPLIQRWLLRHPRLHVPFAPKGAPWINQVEWVLADLTNRQLCRSGYRSTIALEHAIRDYIDAKNRNLRPFVWIKTADDIFASIERALVSESLGQDATRL
jgi:hypothetical protein